MAYDFMAISQERVPAEIKDHITMYKPYRTDGTDLGGIIQLDNGTNYFIVPDEHNGFIAKRVYLEDESEEDPVLRVWGAYREYDPWFRTDGRLFQWLEDQLTNTLVMENTCKWNHRLRAFQAMRSNIAVGKISIYQTQRDRDNDRQVAMRPARAFSFMFPEIDHKQIIVMTDSFLREFSERQLTLHVSQEAEDFSLAYSGKQSPTENIHTTYNRKSIAHSCMRYDFDNLPVHPATAYASGDFEIVYTTDQNGHIASRCVVYLNEEGDQKQAGPIYGVSEQALDVISHHLIARSVNLDGLWDGAKLKRIPYGSNGFIAPYIDPEPRTLTDDGKHLIISYRGEIDASCYSGVLNDYDYTCHECGGGVHEDDYWYSECTEERYCESCYHDTHFYCESYGEHFHNDEMRTAYYINRYGHKIEVTVSRAALDYNYDYVYCESDGEWWSNDDALFCQHEDCYIDPITYKADYFMSDWDDEIYPNSQMCTTEDGETVAFDEIYNSFEKWYKNDKDIYCRKETE